MEESNDVNIVKSWEHYWEVIIEKKQKFLSKKKKKKKKKKKDG